MRIESVTLRGSGEWNEDMLIVREADGLFGVLDGATSLTPFRDADGVTGGALASRIVSGVLNRIVVEPEATCLALADALLEANRTLGERMALSGVDPACKEALWSASALLVRVKPDAIDYAQAGDCMLVAEYADGSFRTVTRDQLAFLDRETQRLWADALRQGIAGRDERWQAVLPQIAAGRRSANTDEGYAVLNGDPALARYVEAGTINRMNLRSLLLMTDGLYMPKADPAEAFDAEEAARLIAGMGLGVYAAWLEAYEREDAECAKFPRVKVSDDKTAIRLTFADG